MVKNNLPQNSLQEIIAGCEQEAQQERQQEKGHCFELFRRALDEQEPAAWTAIAEQYGRLMLGWVYAYPGNDFAPEEAEQLIHEALERFWRTLTSRSIQVATSFEHIGALLKYLQQCVVATLLDQKRRAQRTARLIERLQSTSIEGATYHVPSPEEHTIERLQRTEQLQRVTQWMRVHVTDPLEQRLLYLSYEEDLTPAAIAHQYPQEFSDAQMVRRMKERILKRARRALLESAQDHGPNVEVNASNER